MSLNSLYMALEELLHLPEVQLLPCKLLGKGTRIALLFMLFLFLFEIGSQVPQASFKRALLLRTLNH